MDVIICILVVVVTFVVLYLYLGLVEVTCLKNRLEAADIFIKDEQKRQADLRKDITKLVTDTYQRRIMATPFPRVSHEAIRDGQVITISAIDQYSSSTGVTVEEAINALVEHSGCDLITQPGTKSKTVLVKKTPTKKVRSTRK